MKASVVDLRYKMKEVLKALRRRETVEILYHGKPAGYIVPTKRKRMKKKDFLSHPFFKMRVKDDEPVERIMERLRGDRYRGI